MTLQYDQQSIVMEHVVYVFNECFISRVEMLSFMQINNANNII